MANHKSAVKRIRQSRKRQMHNKSIRSAMRTVLKNARLALEGEDGDAAKDKIRAAEASLRRAASKGLIPKKRADRTVSRMTKRLNAMSS